MSIVRLDRGVLRHNVSYYVEVGRKSTHQCVGGKTILGKCYKGFGRERDSSGFYHFNTATCGDYKSHCDLYPRGIYLRVDRPVIDYTCPLRVVYAKRGFKILRLPPTGAHWQYGRANFTSIFTRALELKCVDGWCTPAASCLRAIRGDFDPWLRYTDRLNDPAFWKADPPRLHHRFTRQGFNFRTAIVLWAGHDFRILDRCRARRSCADSPQVVVDYRQYGVTDDSYVNGTRMIACQPGHNYYTQHQGRMNPCACVGHQKYLNCAG